MPKPVFFDPRHTRARNVLGAAALLLIIATVWVFDFVNRVYQLAPLPDIGPLPRHTSAPATDVTIRFLTLRPEIQTDCGHSALQPSREYNRISGFIPYGDLTAASDARATCQNLQDIYFEAWNLDTITGNLIPVGPESDNFPMAEYRYGWNAINRPGSYPVFRPESFASTPELEALLLGGMELGFIDQLPQMRLGLQHRGLCLDLSDHPDLSRSAFAAAVRGLNSALSSTSLETCLVVDIMAAALAEEDLLSDVERIVVRINVVELSQIYRAEPLAALHQTIARVIRDLPASKLRVALDSRGFSLGSGQRRGRLISFAEAMHVASLENVTMSFSARTGLHLIRYVDQAGAFHQIWLPDVDVMLGILNDFSISVPVVLWPIGYEDPSIWELISLTEEKDTRESSIDLSRIGNFEGTGPFFAAISPAQLGHRTTSIDVRTGQIISATIDSVPNANNIRFFGDVPGTHTLSIAFQGLPTEAVESDLMELLDELSIGATFFVTTQDTLQARDSIGPLRDKGHQIGATLGPQSALLPLPAEFRNKLTQHLLAFNTGRQSRFIIDPSARMDSSASPTEDLLRQVREVQQDGYIVVRPTIFASLSIESKPSLLDEIYSHALMRSTNLIVFDISALDQKAIYEVLRPVLLQLDEDGFDFRPLTFLAGITAREAAPVVAFQIMLRDYFNNAVLTISWKSIQGLIFGLALVVALRYPIYLILALVRRKKFKLDIDYHPPVTLVIPAFNEEGVIRRTLDSAINVDYPDFKIIVVDDGSSDHTSEIVREYTNRLSNIELYAQPNSGKWSALDHAVNHVETPIMVILDADSLIDPMALREIVQPFKDERIGAVSGTVEIGNRDGLLTIFQRIEYLHMQQILRRAYEVFDGIIVVPGAIGAWRVSAVKKAGLFTGDTITEDADLTFAIHRCGYKIGYQENAKSFTEAPMSIRDLHRQRIRWTFGMFQTSWKHKHAIIEGRPVGIISLIDAIWYQLITSLFYPFFDIYFIILIVRVLSNIVMQGDLGDVAISQEITAGYLLIIFFGFLNIVAAMFLARRFEPELFFLAPFARFGYRQILYLTAIEAVVAGVLGRHAAWNKLDRSGTARLIP